jgi:lipopolysaccharide biosynthesis regulator YciM
MSWDAGGIHTEWEPRRSGGTVRWLERSRIARASRATDGDWLRRSLLAALDADWAEVEDLLGRLVRADSRDIDVYLALGRLYRQRGEVGRAIALHQTLILRRDLDPRRHHDALVELAADFQLGGFTARSIAAYEEVLEHDPRRPDALRAMVDLLAEAGEPARAFKVLRRLERVERKPSPRRRAELMCEVALRARDDGQLDAARRAVRKAVRFDAEYAEALMLLASLEAERGHADKALATWERALDLAPERAPALLAQIAHALTAKGQRPLYQRMLRERLSARPDDAPACLALARLLVDAGQSDEARALLEGLVGRDPDHVEAHVALGRLLLVGSEEAADSELAKGFGALLDALDAGHKRQEKA